MQKVAAIFLSFIVGISVYQIFEMRNQRADIVFLDVGQGDATHIRVGEYDVLIDGGPDGAVLTELGKTLPFYDRSIEMVVVTHFDADHITGLVEVLKRYRVETFVVKSTEPDSELSQALIDAAQKNGVKIHVPQEREQLTIVDGVYINFFNVSKNLRDRNNDSLVSRIVVGDSSVLITGDLEAEGESGILSRRSFIESDILKAGHHGSKTSTIDMFLKTVAPNEVVISAGAENRYGHPHPSVIERIQVFGSEISETQFGMIQYELRE